MKISVLNIINVRAYWMADIVIVAYGCRIHIAAYNDGDVT